MRRYACVFHDVVMGRTVICMESMGRLLQLARQINTGMSQAEAARAAGFKSKVYWGQIEAGIKLPPAGTGARMARVVGLTPAQLKKAGQGDAADELAEILDIFGPFVGDGADRELVTRIGELSEEQRKALFTLLKLLPSVIPVGLATLFRWRPRPKALVASSAGTAASLAMALAVIWLPGSPGDQTDQPGVSELPRQRGPTVEAPPARPRQKPGAVGPTQPPGAGHTQPSALALHLAPAGGGSSDPSASQDLPTPGSPGVKVPPVVAPRLAGGKATKCAVRVVARSVVRACLRLPLG
jgi:transcriptional regulator with XRE-family HTH domain